MSQDFINDLPPELLRQVFDFLNHQEREKAAAVCQRWSDIVASGRYVDKLEIELRHLVNGNMNVLKRYRSISTVNFAGLFRDGKSRLQKFLNDKEVMKNVEELHIALKYIRWADLFPMAKQLRFPELQKMTFQGLKVEDAASILYSSIIAPKMKALQIIESPPVWLLANQIETLLIDCIWAVELPHVDLFPKLRSLTLKNINTVTINDTFKKTANRLKELQILDIININFRDVFDNVQNIESLSISSEQPMSAELYAVINAMGKLKQLSLDIPIEKSAKGLSLPHLEKLTMPQTGWPPLENVPNLRSLCIESKTYVKDHVNRKRMSDYFRSFGHQLHHLTLRKVFLNEDLVNQICSFDNLQTLRMFDIDAEFQTVEKIFQPTCSLRLFRLESSTVVGNFIPCDGTDQCECEDCIGLLWPAPQPSQELLKERFSSIITQHVDCAITVVGSCFVEKAIPKHVWDY